MLFGLPRSSGVEPRLLNPAMPVTVAPWRRAHAHVAHAHLAQVHARATRAHRLSRIGCLAETLAAAYVCRIQARRLSTVAMMSTTGVHQQHLTKCAEEIRSGVKVVHEAYERRISSLVSAAESGHSVSFASTFGALADADGFASLASVELTLPALVSGDPEARAASAAAKKSLSDMWSKTYTRPDLYKILHAAKDSAETTEEIRLVTVVLEKFRQSGCGLASDDREELASLDRRCKELAFQARPERKIIAMGCFRIVWLVFSRWNRTSTKIAARWI